ncbi:S-layer homology domain-containing protein [Candidatus Peregrinibacteria bacterium]|nr:S-layer homology domain-containing protein [Candidatus Peregrinibacteria bacterium]
MFGNKNKNKKKRRHSIHHHEHNRKRIQKILFYVVIGLFMLSSLASFGNMKFFRASVLPVKPVPAFDGTTYPIKLIPNWVKLASNEWNLTFQQIPEAKRIAIPKYDPAVLKTPIESLKYGNPADDAIKNAKLTYPVAYLGGYKLDGVENSGSHPAVDIKIPIGTPVYAIANGAVMKTALSSAGFGNHIVIMHPNVPSLDTLYSAYAHLSQITVSEGDVVLKGQQIGLSGDSGLSSAPHLHFQMDTDSAPWHPYWPFTYKDISDAGLKSFNDAINNGLGKDKALVMTINPMNYVQKYMVYAGSTQNTTTPQNTDNNQPNTNGGGATTTDSGADINTNTSTVAADMSFKITGKSSYMWNEGVVFTITAYSDDKVFTGNLPDSVAVSLTNSAVGMLDKTIFVASDFTNGVTHVSLINPAPGKASIIAGYQGKNFTSLEFEISPQGFNPRERVIFTDDIRSDLQGSLLFADVSSTFPNYLAIQYLKQKGIVAGYSDGTFKPEQVVSRAEAIKLILEAIGAQLKDVSSIPFSDVKNSDWFAKYVMTGFSDNIVKGYSDGKFKPANIVSKVEFLKMLLIAMKIDVNPLVASAPYSDVLPSEWYAAYVNFAKEKNIVQILGSNFGPAEGMKRKDVAEVIYRAMILKETGADRYTESLAMAN